MCTHGHALTRACTHSPVLRKSKIAVSLNSFPLAAWTAFVLQTKRKRNETETRTQSRQEKEGDGPGNTQRKGETEGRVGRGSERERQRQTGHRMRKSPALCIPPCKGPSLPHISHWQSLQSTSSPSTPPRAVLDSRVSGNPAYQTGRPLSLYVPSPAANSSSGSPLPGNQHHFPTLTALRPSV